MKIEFKKGKAIITLSTSDDDADWIKKVKDEKTGKPFRQKDLRAHDVAEKLHRDQEKEKDNGEPENG